MGISYIYRGRVSINLYARCKGKPSLQGDKRASRMTRMLGKCMGITKRRNNGHSTGDGKSKLCGRKQARSQAIISTYSIQTIHPGPNGTNGSDHSIWPVWIYQPIKTLKSTLKKPINWRNRSIEPMTRRTNTINSRQIKGRGRLAGRK